MEHYESPLVSTAETPLDDEICTGSPNPGENEGIGYEDWVIGGSSLYGADSNGYYWSSTFIISSHAWNLYFYSGNVYTGNCYYIDSGQPLRPVYE